MADQVALQAATGRELGSSSSRRLRSEGKIPAVVYGLDSEPTPISLDYGAARTALSTDAGLNALLNLEIDGNTSRIFSATSSATKSRTSTSSALTPTLTSNSKCLSSSSAKPVLLPT